MNLKTFRTMMNHLHSLGLSLRFTGQNRISLGNEAGEEEYLIEAHGDAIEVYDDHEAFIFLMAYRPGVMYDPIEDVTMAIDY